MARPPQDEKVRFLSKLVVQENGCHEWQSTLDRGGYGKFFFRGKQDKAHRVAYLLFKGPVPAGTLLMHTCDNRKCVNVDHLMIGSRKANVVDMDSKKRRGTKSSLTERDADLMRTLLKNGVKQRVIAEAFGVDQTTVSRVKLGKTNLFLKE